MILVLDYLIITLAGQK